MGITGSLIVYISIWWIVFFSVLPVGIKSENKQFRENLEGNDPGAPKNPKIGKKFIITTIITTVLFFGIYYMVSNDYFNLREYLQ
jgi:predicted secreted protein|tara:strand:- start:1952 stop:2206 length:255 start_codon:yes stop_codon:yes gene_type:complete